MPENATRSFNDVYSGDALAHIAFPLGGIGAGMVCLEGAGALSHVSLRGQADVFNEPLMFAALYVAGGNPGAGANGSARVLEGPAPAWKIYGAPNSASGAGGKDYGLPHFAEASFRARFPFATIRLAQPGLPLSVELTGWSPFIPRAADDSSLPVAALEYRFANLTGHPVEAVFSFHARNFMSTWRGPAAGPDTSAVLDTAGGFVLWQPGSDERPAERGAFSAAVDDPAVRVNCAWFRGAWFDPLTVLWRDVSAGAAPAAGPLTEGEPSPGGSLYVPFTLAPGAEKTICLRLAWHVPDSGLRAGQDPAGGGAGCGCNGGCAGADVSPATHRPWYAGAFAGIEAVAEHWRRNYASLRARSQQFSDCFYDSTLPPAVIEAVAANLGILKTPTVQRQADGRLWCWEGCNDASGCCHGSCTHVWNYAQALPHLFPSLERTLREVEFHESQNLLGHQNFRANLPIRLADHSFHAAADGQLGGIMKVYREWRIGGDTEWLRGLWPCVRQSLDYCIHTWDPDGRGVLVEPHHNTYDIEFWGPDGMCTSFYLGALRAATLMAEALGEDPAPYPELYARGRAAMESDLWNGEYFYQRVQWQGLRAGDPTAAQSLLTHYSPEARALLQREGPKYQYGTGCLSDGVLGAWIAAMCGVGDILDPARVESHLAAVFAHNFCPDLSDHANPQRPTYALGHEAGLLVCSWPRGEMPSLPFPYSNEVWTGIEYHVASHLALVGRVDEAQRLVEAARRRYDGRVRDPFDEYECGHWYARAMSSYGLLQGLTGVRYDAVDKTLYIQPHIAGDFRSFLCTATGYGTVGVKDGKPFVEVVEGAIPYERIEYGG